MDRPKLRKVERHRAFMGGEDVLVLRDPLELAEPVAVAAEFADVLDLLDGSRTVAQIRQTLLMRGTHDLPAADLAEFVDNLGLEGFLDDERFLARWEALHEAFLDEDPRAPRAAGAFYPEDPETLAQQLESLVPDVAGRVVAGSDVIGVMVPHAPLELSGSVLDATLRDLPPAQEIDLVIALGTDHMPGLLPFAITPKRYGTPLGAVPAASAMVEALQRRLPWTTREEIRHRSALSLELAALQLRWIYGDACPPMLPVLCGQAVLRSTGAGNQELIDRFTADLEALTDDRRVLWWGSAELSHAGVAYGRPQLDDAARDAVAQRDASVLSSLAASRLDDLERGASESHDQGRPSGGAVMSTLVRLLPVGYRAEVASYELAQPPGEATGAIGLAGVRFRMTTGRRD
jgi:AmmeMemoRadiSam system protein B